MALWGVSGDVSLSGSTLIGLRWIPRWHQIMVYFRVFFKFVYFLRERENASGEGRERRPRGSEAGSALSTQPDAGPKLTNREIMTWAGVRGSGD